MKKLILIFGIFLIFLFGKNLKAQVIQQDFDALVALYNATDGDNWYYNTGWNTTVNDVSDDWTGVTVEGDRVVNLAIYNLNLNGTIPSQIGNLTALTKLAIGQNNNLTGPIPEEIGNLTNLTYLSFMSDSFTGDIPNSICNLTNLVYLNLEGNSLTDYLPSSFDNLTNLIELNLSYIGLSEFSHVICNLDNLQRLNLRNNDFTTLPVELSQLTNLTFLDVSNNEFTEFPIALTQMNNLDSLSFSYNYIYNLPPEIGNMSDLVRLGLNNTQLSSLPDEFSNLTQLNELYLAECDFTEIPSQLSTLTNLTIIRLDNDNHDMYGNNIDTIPEFITNLTNLQKLYLRNNYITSIPDYIYNMTSLNYLFLDNNQITGSLSPLISNLTNLISLDLPNNNMSGELPIELSNMTSLLGIILTNNSFEGQFPYLANLWGIKIENNNFTQLPDYSTNFITDLKIENNYFTFEDIEPNQILYNFTYSPQKDIIIDHDTIILPLGAELDLAIDVGGEFNQYQWFKNDVAVNTVSEDSSYSVITDENSFGTYKCEVTNILVTDLTISTIPIQVLRDYAPVISTIPAQSVFQGEVFEPIILDNFVTDDYTNDTAIIWSTNTLTNFSVNIDENRIATISALNPEWIGQETITFTATDQQGLGFSKDVVFRVLAPNTAPVLSQIPDQTIIQGNQFATINLNNYVTDDYTTTNNIDWTTNSLTNYNVTISSGKIATIHILNSVWFGSETITFTATDQQGLYSSKDAVFTIEELINISEFEDLIDVYTQNDKIYINLNNYESFDIEIYNAQGYLLYKDKINHQEIINLSEKGLLIVKIYNSNFYFIKKIVLL